MAQRHVIFHVSDIHIRLHHRHDEYRHVFEQVNQSISQWKISHPTDQVWIVLTGDIFHHKIEFSPESIVLAVEWLRQLGELAPTLLIAGNHDMLQKNQERLDNLSALLHDRLLPHVSYLKYSGEYRCPAFPDMVWHVHSLVSMCSPEDPLSFVDRSMWTYTPFSEPRVVDSRVWNIGLYHGGVGTFQLQNQFSMKGDIDIDTFLSYQMTCLGDIHVPQFVDADKCKVAYAGSLLSQNVGEGGYRHGYLRWVVTKQQGLWLRDSCTFVPIQNPHAYVDVRVVKENEETMQVEVWGKMYVVYHDGHDGHAIEGGQEMEECSLFWAKIFPDHGRITVYAPQRQSMDRFRKWMTRRYPEKQCSWTWKCTIEECHTSTSPLSLPFSSTENMTQQTVWTMESVMQYVSQVLEKHHKMDVLPWIQQELLTVSPWTSTVSSPLCTTWSIDHIEGQHLFSYGSFSIPLSSTRCLGVFGKNSSGKSTLIDILTLLLYGKITRYAHGNKIPSEVIHCQQSSSWGSITLRVHDKRIRLRKDFQRNRKTQKIKCQERLWVWNSERQCMEEQTQEDARHTQLWLRPYIGTFETFCFLCVQSQQPSPSFREMTQKERKEFLYDQFHLRVYEDKKEEYVQHQRELLMLQKIWSQQPAHLWKDDMEDGHLQDRWTHQRQEAVSLYESARQQYQQCSERYHQLCQDHVSCSWTLDDVKKALEECTQSSFFLFPDLSSFYQDFSHAPTLSMEEIEEEQTTWLKRFHEAKERLASLQPPVKLVYSEHVLASFAPSMETLDQYSRFVEWSHQWEMTWQEWEQVQYERQEWEWKRKDRLCQLKDGWDAQRGSVSVETHRERLARLERTCRDMQKEIVRESVKYTEMEETTIQTLEKTTQAFERVWTPWWTQWKNLQVEKQRGVTEMKELRQVTWNPDCHICRAQPYVRRLEELETQDRHYVTQQSTLMNQVRQTILPTWWDMTEKKDEYDAIYDAPQESMDELQQVMTRLSLDVHVWVDDTQSRFREWEEWKQQQTTRHVLLEQYQRELEHAQQTQWHIDRAVLIRACERETFRGEQRWKQLQHAMTQSPTRHQIQCTRDAWNMFRLHQQDMKTYMETLASRHEQCRLLQQHNQRWESYVQHQKIQRKYRKWQKRQQVVRLYQEQQQQRQQMYQEYQDFQSQVQQRQQDMDRIQRGWEEFQQRKEEYLGWKKEGERLDQQLEKAKWIIFFCSRDGIPLFLLQFLLPRFSQLWNQVIQPFLPDMEIDISLVEKEVQFAVRRITDQSLQTHFFGGMEHFLLHVSCKVVLHQLSSCAKPSLFILDEGVSVLDEDRIHELPLFFRYLHTLFDHVWIISHIPSVRDFVDEWVDVQRNAEGYSNLTFHALSSESAIRTVRQQG